MKKEIRLAFSALMNVLLVSRWRQATTKKEELMWQIFFHSLRGRLPHQCQSSHLPSESPELRVFDSLVEIKSVCWEKKKIVNSTILNGGRASHKRATKNPKDRLAIHGVRFQTLMTSSMNYCHSEMCTSRAFIN